MRRVPAFVFDKENYRTLSYSVKEDGVYCADCVAFSTSQVTLVSRPLTDWSNAKKQVDKHLTSKDHQIAVSKSREFLKVCTKEQDSITGQLNKAYQDTVNKNRDALSSIVRTIILCGRQNLALRGRQEDHGNFISLLKYRAETDQALATHLANAPKNATYISPLIQNELINLCGKQISTIISSECKKANFFTLLADECSDVSNTEQISLCLRYVHSEKQHHTVKEEFLQFIPTRDITGDTLSSALSVALTDAGLGECVMVGQGYDGAGNMSGHTKGVQARMLKIHPHATYVHCQSHNLNLAISKACELPLVRNMYDTARKILNFIPSSPKRLQVFLDHNYGNKLRKFCPIQWTYHTETIHVSH